MYGGWYQKGNTCLKMADFLPGEGLNLTTSQVKPCVEPNCLNCSQNIAICKKCNDQQEWYLKSSKCVQPQQFAVGEGCKLDDGTVQDCTDMHCVDCRADYSKCTICDFEKGWYQKDFRCIQKPEFLPQEGVDTVSSNVMNCSNDNCKNCVDDYTKCTECDQANGYILVNGNCELPSTVGSLNLKRTKYEFSEKTAVVEFSELSESLGLEENKPTIVTILDEVEEKTYHCESAANKTGIRCELLPLPNGFQIKFTSDVSIVKGKVIIQDPAQQNSPKGYIRAASSKVLFKDYPIVIDGLSFAENKALESASSIMRVVSPNRSFITMSLAVVALPLLIVLERFLADIRYLSLVEGRVLVFPERVFDSSMSLSTYIPVSLIGVPDWMLAFQDMSTCVPSPAMARNDLYCSILANMGPDVFTTGFLSYSGDV